MVAGFTVKVTGAAEAARTFGLAASDLNDLTRANDEVGRIITEAAQSGAPRRTGNLASSVKPTVTRDTVTVGSSLVYAGPIINGWVAHHIHPNPFVSDGAERSRSQWEKVYDEAIAKICKQVHGK